MSACDTQQNALDSLKKLGIIDEVRIISNRDRFDQFNKAYTKYAQSVYNLDTEGELLFDTNLVEKEYAKTSYRRTDKKKIYFAEPKTYLFEKLNELLTQKELLENTNNINTPVSFETETAVAEMLDSDMNFASQVYSILGFMDDTQRYKYQVIDLMNMAQEQRVTAIKVYAKYLEEGGKTPEKSSTNIASTIYELIPNITDEQIDQIYNNYVALMGRARKGKEISKDVFKNLLSSYQVFNYKDTYIFGQYDADNAVFITRLNSSPSSKELLAEALPTLVKQGIDFASFVPIDVANKYKRSGYSLSTQSFDYNFKGEDMLKYLAVSNPNVSIKVFGKALKDLSAKDINEYNNSQKLRYTPVEIKGELIEKAGKDASAVLQTYLSGFGITVKDINEMKSRIGIDEFGFADMLSKIIYTKDKESIAPLAGEFIAYMMQHNNLIKDIIVELSKTDDYKGLSKSKYFKLIGELIAEDLQNKINKKNSVSLLNLIKQLIKKFFNIVAKVNVELINTNIGIITNNILQQNKKLVTASLYKPGAIGKPVSQVSLEEALRKDKFGASIVKRLAKLGFILTGSTSLAEQGTIYRPDENPLHDIDWISPFTLEDTISKFLKVYPDAIFVRTISENDNYRTDSYIIAPEGHSIKDYKVNKYIDGKGVVKTIIDSYNVVDKNGKIVGTYRNVEGQEIVEGVEGKVIDFFIYNNYKKMNRNDPFSYTTKEGYTILLANWKDTFNAKLDWARYKDIWDYNRFIPNENTNQITPQQKEKDIEGFKEFVNKSLSDPSFYRETSYPEVLQLLDINLDILNDNYSKDIANKLLTRFSKSLKTAYVKISQEEAKEILKNSDIPYKGEPAFYYGGILYFIADRVSTNSVLHEFGHPLFRAIRSENPELFTNLYNLLKSTSEGEAIINMLKTHYSELSEGTDRFKEEALVFGLQHEATLKLKEEQGTKEFKNWVQKALYLIKKAFKKIFKTKNSIKDLDVNTTLTELAEKYLNEAFEFDQFKLQDTDLVAYARLVNERAQQLRELSSAEGVIKIVNSIYSGNDAVLKMAKEFRKNKKIRKWVEESMFQKGTTQLAPGVKKGLSSYETISTNNKNKDQIIDEVLDAEERRLNEITKASIAIITSLDTINISAKEINLVTKNILKRRDINDRSIIHLLGLYTSQITAWKNMIKNINDITQGTPEGVTSSIFYKTVSEIESNISQIQQNIDKIYHKSSEYFISEITGLMNQYVSNTFKENLSGIMKDNLTDEEFKEFYDKAIQQKLTEEDLKAVLKKGVNEKLLKDYIKEYDTFVITAEKIQSTLQGETRDVSWFNRYLESYSSSDDIIVGPVSVFIEDRKREADMEVYEASKAFRLTLAKLLPKVGFNKLNTQQLRDMLTDIDKVFVADQKTGEAKAFEVYTFLNEFGNGWRFEEDRLEYALKEARDSGDKDAIRKAFAELKEFRDNYMWREYVPEYYEKDEIFESSPIAKEAWLDRQNALDEYNLENNKFNNELERLQNYSTIEAKFRAYQQLYSLSYEDGSPKIDDPENGIYDLTKAKILIEHRKQTRKFYEYVPLEGSLQTSYTEFVNSLRGEGLTKTDGEWDQRIAEWKKINLRMTYSDEYYSELNRLFTRLNELQDKVADKYDFNPADGYKRITDLLISFKDSYGQPDNEALGSKRVKDIQEIQQNIIDFQHNFNIQSGLTREELDRLNDLNQKLKTSELTDTQKEEYVKLIEKQKVDGLSSAEALEFNSILSELSSLSNTVPTEYYMDQLSYNLSKVKAKEAKESEVQDLINSDEFFELLDKDKNFKKWFDRNHVYTYRYDKKKKKYIKYYIPSRANTYKIPTNKNFIKTTTIIDPETNKEIVLEGTPNSRHSIQRVKNEYRTIPFGESKEKFVGKVIDNKGNFLPRPYEPGNPNSAIDDRFVNKRYMEMKKANTAQYQLLEAIKEFHLEMQKGKSVYARLYLDVPRYAVNDVLETIQAGKGLDRFKQIKEAIIEKGKQAIGRSVVNVENDFNYDVKNNLVNTDLDGNQVSYIPVSGIYRLEKEQVSADILEGIFTYATSLTRQSKLNESLGMVQALLSTLENPDNQPKNMDAYRRDAFTMANQLKRPNKKTSTYNRAGQLRSLIEREYFGVKFQSIGEYAPTLAASLTSIQKISSRASLAVNIPSDLKNRGGQWVNNIIEAAGGEFITLKDLALARVTAAKAMMNWSSKDIYAVGPETLTSQLIIMLDPIFKTADAKRSQLGGSVTRSVVKDLINGEWMYMHRKFGEMEVALQLFFAFLHAEKIDQVLSDGTVKSIRYMDAWETDENGIARLKPGIDPAWGSTTVKHIYTKGETLDEIAKKYNVTRSELEQRNNIKSETQLDDQEEIIIARSEKFKALKNKIQGVSRRLYGAYDDFGQPEGNKYIGYRMFFFMRKWFTPMFVNRFGMATDKENFGGYRYDWATNTYTKGYYISAFQALYKVLVNKGVKYSMLSPKEKAAVIKTTAEGLFTVAMSLLFSMLFGFYDDDPDKWKKLKEKSGALGTDEFRTWGFMSNHMLLLLMGVQAETSTFIPLPKILGINFGLDEYNKMLTSNTSAFYNTLTLYFQIFGDVLNILTGNDDAVRYKRDTGPYWWQEKGTLKIWKRLFKTVGFTGGTGDPESLIKSLKLNSERL